MICPVFEKNDKSKFSWLAVLFKHFFIKIQPNMSEQEKKCQRIYETRPKKMTEIIGISSCPSSSPDLNPLDYIIWDILESKANATYHPNIALLKIVIEEERNKMSEEFILNTCWYNNWTKWQPYWLNLLFCVYLFILLFIF